MTGRVLGLDPGSIRTGWGVIAIEGSRTIGVAAGVIRVSEKAPIEKRLTTIYEGLCEVLATYTPASAAVEDIFFARFPRAAMVLGHARGVALLAVAQRGLEVHAYPPSVVKRAVVGTGQADKRQVALLVQAVLGLRELPAEDATDALAIALTHASTLRMPVARRG